jgi:hypothetical protein
MICGHSSDPNGQQYRVGCRSNSILWVLHNCERGFTALFAAAVVINGPVTVVMEHVSCLHAAIQAKATRNLLK